MPDDDLDLDLDLTPGEPCGCGHCEKALDRYAPVTPPGRPWPPGDSTEPLDLDTDGGAWDAPIFTRGVVLGGVALASLFGLLVVAALRAAFG
jgi:hypothetical protein